MVGKGVGSTGPAGETSLQAPSSLSLMGMANPMPETGLPVLSVSNRETTTPITCPNIFGSDSPLFPGFSDASVCKLLSRLAEMMPTLTVGSAPGSSPKGEPYGDNLRANEDFIGVYNGDESEGLG